MRRAALLACSLLLVACGAAPLRPMSSTRCHAVRPLDAVEPSASDWTRLLTIGDEAGHQACAAELALSPRHLNACGERVEAIALGRIEPRLIAHQREGTGPDVIWVAVEANEAGIVAGPVAVVVRSPLGLEVQALGWLRGPEARAQLRIHALPEGNVIAAMLHVGDEEHALLLAQSGGALTPAGITEDAQCAPGNIIVRATTTGEGSSRAWMTRTLQSALLRVEEGALVIEEHTLRTEVPRSDPSAPARSTETAQRRRMLHLSGARLSERQ